MKRLIFALSLAIATWSCSEGDTPAEPEPVVEPETPSEPDTPEDPSTPDGPDTPDDPEPEPNPVSYPYENVAAQLTITTKNGVKISSKEDYVECTVSMTHANEEWNLAEVTAGVRGRGNSTWLWYDKKPYRIKFDKKQSVLGLPKAKSWVLLAEYRDPTDLMNTFVFELGRLMGLPYTNHNRYVELTLNGEYVGLYHLTEQIQQGDNRVEIDEVNGYLIQLDVDDGPAEAPSATDNFWSEVYRMPVCVKNPDTPSADRLAEVKASLASLENAVKGGDYEEVGRLMDISTMIDFLIIQELVYNVELDAPRSMYMHRDAGGKWAMGPLWDFDAGFDFDWADMTHSHNYFSNYRELVLGSAPATHAGTNYRVPGFFSDLFKMKSFVSAYKTRWKEVSTMVEPAWTAAETFKTANADLWTRDAQRWPIGKSPDAETDKMHRWLGNRVVYLNNIIANYPAGNL